MFRVKICGITSIQDAVVAAREGAEAIGLNFFPGSPRFVSLDQATQITRAIQTYSDFKPALVGIFVNAPVEEMVCAVEKVGLGWVQLHGDEPPGEILRLRETSNAGLQIIRAFRVAPGGLHTVLCYLEVCENRRCLPDAILFDAAVQGTFGGSGQRTAWDDAAAYVDQTGAAPLVLAGGLRPENVAEAIRTVRPWAVDTASGVEIQPRKKDPEKIRAFVAAAKSAFASISGESLYR